MDRRHFLGAAAAIAAGGSAAARPAIVDTHIHLFDTRRPQGVPWPEPKSALYKPALPERYRKMAEPLGVRAAVVVEASPWLEDNQWVLDQAAKSSMIAGVVGNLDPGKPEFGRQLERFRRNPLFRGIRYGNLWGRDLAAEVEKPEFVAGLKLLAGANLSLDTANPDARLLGAVLRLTDRVPELRVVIDHLPQMDLAGVDLGEFAARPRVFVKLSEVFRRVNGAVPRDIGVYRAGLDQIAGVFGEDRTMFGSDWPNADQWRPFAEVVSLMQEYFTGRVGAAEKYFRRNAERAYGVRV